MRGVGQIALAHRRESSVDDTANYSGFAKRFSSGVKKSELPSLTPRGAYLLPPPPPRWWWIVTTPCVAVVAIELAHHVELVVPIVDRFREGALERRELHRLGHGHLRRSHDRGRGKEQGGAGTAAGRSRLPLFGVLIHSAGGHTCHFKVAEKVKNQAHVRAVRFCSGFDPHCRTTK